MQSNGLPHAQVSTVLGSALPEQRKEGEWIEGVAIWVAVLIVIGVGEHDRDDAAPLASGGRQGGAKHPSGQWAGGQH